jgi:hypothetical protein
MSRVRGRRTQGHGSQDHRTQGHRTTVDRTASSGRAAVLGAMVVGLTAAVLTLAGTTPRGIGAPVETFERVALDERTFICPGGIADSTAVHGSVDEGLADSAPITELPLRFDQDKSVALSSFAGQQARTANSLAWLPCPEPHARWWFVGAGASSVIHDTVLSVSNPRAGVAVLDIEVYGPKGPVEAPGLTGVTVAPGGNREIDLAKVAPAAGDLAVHVVARRGLVTIGAADRFAPGVVGKTVREWLPGQSLPSNSITLAGLPAKPTSASLVVVNPSNVEAIVAIEVIGASGTFAPKDNPTMTIAPQSVATLPIRSVFDGDPLAVRVKSARRVTATIRSLTDDDVSFATGVRPVSGSTAFAVPTTPSGAAQLVLSSVTTKTAVTVEAFDRLGRPILDRVVTVPAVTSVGTRLPRGTRYVRLTARDPVAVAGFTLADGSGVATAGVLPAIRSVRLPAVRPGW